MPDRNGNLLDNVTPTAAESPFGPVRKREPKPEPRIPGPRKPADRVTPLLLTGRTRPTATRPAYDADLVWLAAEAHRAPDSSEMRSAA